MLAPARSGKEPFHTGAIDEFEVELERDLGDLRALRVWHDSFGRDPHWFLESITIRNQHTGQTWHFRCSRWLSRTRGESLLTSAELFPWVRNRSLSSAPLLHLAHFSTERRLHGQSAACLLPLLLVSSTWSLVCSLRWGRIFVSLIQAHMESLSSPIEPRPLFPRHPPLPRMQMESGERFQYEVAFQTRDAQGARWDSDVTIQVPRAAP